MQRGARSDSYLKDVHIRPLERLNGDGLCPHCGSIALVPDMGDLCCLFCGWREASYFYDHREEMAQDLIKRLIFNDVAVLPP
ncbi:MAG: hypothetical protein AMJ70_05110 [Dehalococcoidia bacterium SG8_51_3]|nr:MAG: hypothetical protein AMJ70_05110 [Dehalococcoidia bacterium SG8_51_3]